jgi:hypothetical protein
MKRNTLALAALAGIAGGFLTDPRNMRALPSGPELGPDTPTRAQTRAFKAGRDYPASGTGKRQGERLARQQAKGMLDFSASERCLERIKARIAA